MWEWNVKYKSYTSGTSILFKIISEWRLLNIKFKWNWTAVQQHIIKQISVLLHCHQQKIFQEFKWQLWNHWIGPIYAIQCNVIGWYNMLKLGKTFRTAVSMPRAKVLTSLMLRLVRMKWLFEILLSHKICFGYSWRRPSDKTRHWKLLRDICY